MQIKFFTLFPINFQNAQKCKIFCEKEKSISITCYRAFAIQADFFLAVCLKQKQNIKMFIKPQRRAQMYIY